MQVDGYASDVEDTEVRSRKRRRVMDQIRDGMVNPSPIVSRCHLEDGSLRWACRSKRDHVVVTGNSAGRLIFKCDCQPTGSVRSCRHINAVVLRICLDYMEDSCSYDVERALLERAQASLRDLMGSMSSLSLDTADNADNADNVNNNEKIDPQSS